jgi:hypothetical protein
MNCGRTFIAHSETVYHRLRSSPFRFDRLVQQQRIIQVLLFASDFSRPRAFDYALRH